MQVTRATLRKTSLTEKEVSTVMLVADRFRPICDMHTYTGLNEKGNYACIARFDLKKLVEFYERRVVAIHVRKGSDRVKELLQRAYMEIGCLKSQKS